MKTHTAAAGDPPFEIWHAGARRGNREFIGMSCVHAIQRAHAALRPHVRYLLHLSAAGRVLDAINVLLSLAYCAAYVVRVSWSDPPAWLPTPLSFFVWACIAYFAAYTALLWILQPSVYHIVTDVNMYIDLLSYLPCVVERALSWAVVRVLGPELGSLVVASLAGCAVLRVCQLEIGAKFIEDPARRQQYLYVPLLPLSALQRRSGHLCDRPAARCVCFSFFFV